MFGWGNRYAFPSILKAHHQTGIWLTVITLQPDSVSPLLPPLAVIAIPPIQRRLGIPFPFLIFYSSFCPHQLHLLRHFPFILQAA
ncbi:hypothetical protein ES288_D07G223400v1 [Gossypium darwinii]|uniref:Uncharacterized protein n=1 Tax=Gossypium darwinii TaxID=34276 RepID=A0A5D2C3G9_GOSDA|nr:hypothetical protein ES288_D07G223400v1 [Gossypium darwinii]